MQVLLMSLKAGGVGINLTAASSAFVMVNFYSTFFFSKFTNNIIFELEGILLVSGFLTSFISEFHILAD